VHERGGLERVAGWDLLHAHAREAAEVLVNEGEEPLTGLAIPAAHLLDHGGDLGGLAGLRVATGPARRRLAGMDRIG
jgi:hypothetical protein